MAKNSNTFDGDPSEIEILEFFLGNQSFGLNVIKIQAIEQYDPSKVTKMPLSPPSVLGMLLFRGTTIPLIDLAANLGIESQKYDDEGDDVKAAMRVALVMEFNGVISAVLVDSVNRIHRISWEQISPLSKVLAKEASACTGSVNIENREILIVDMELVVADILPEARLVELTKEDMSHPREHERPNVKIFMAEDSSVIRATMTRILTSGNYTDVTTFSNAKDALDAITDIKAKADSEGKDVSEYITIVISDIEMPQMDGLTLCANIKHKLGLNIPVVIFSSLVNNAMVERCNAAGADANITKPEIAQLVAMVDSLCLDTEDALVTS